MIAIDTSVLIWGIKQQAEPSRLDMIARCVELLRDHKQRKIGIIIPSVAFAEYLCGFSSADQAVQRDIIGRNFSVPPFDAAAAKILGEIYTTR